MKEKLNPGIFLLILTGLLFIAGIFLIIRRCTEVKYWHNYIPLSYFYTFYAYIITYLPNQQLLFSFLCTIFPHDFCRIGSLTGIRLCDNVQITPSYLRKFCRYVTP